MTELSDLTQLTDEAKDALILALGEELQKLQNKKPKKTSKNSSLPPPKASKLRSSVKLKRVDRHEREARVEQAAVVR
jgi:hypothetical protein